MKSMFACGGVLLGGVCLLAGCATDTAALFHYDHKYGLVSGTGKVIVPPEFSYIGDFAANGLAIVSTREGKEGFMNTRGRMVIPPIFEDANTAGFIGDNLARVKLQGQWGDLDSKGNFFPLTKGGDSTHPEKRAWNVPCREPNAKEIKQDGKLGLADAEGKVLIPPRFDAIDGFSCGEIAVFREHRKEGLVNDKGEILAPPEFDAIGSFFSVSAWAKKDGVEGYIDRKGQFIFQYSETCGVPVVLDRWSRIIWPPLSKAQICAEAKK
ncbi:MAG: WG repeat-containing protein, partial [Zoogloeaceae bacterium]|nr:WG repeat-containing protein [Zoogloeaceae bacterium]